MSTETKAKPALSAIVDGLTLALDFSNGKSIFVDAAELTDDIKSRAMMHGLEQKLRDAAALPFNKEQNRYATVDEKYDAVAEVHERLMAGEWNKVREGGERGGMLFRALSRMFSAKTAEQVRDWMAEKTKDELAALRINPKVKAHLDAIEAETIAARTKGIDSDAMLEGLEAGE
jgi:hypothetical protein